MSTPSIDPSVIVAGSVAYIVVIAALYVWIGLALSRVFRKSGVEGWKAWVPVLNTIVLLQLGGYSGWLVLLGLVPVANIVLVVFLIISYHRINVSFGHGAGMTVLAALLFPVWATILGFGSSRWVGRETPAPAGPLRSGPPPLPGTDAGAFAAGARPAGAPPAGYAPITPPPGYGAQRPTGAPAFGPPRPSGPPAGYPAPGAPAPGAPAPGAPAPGAPAAPAPAPSGWMPPPPQPSAVAATPAPASGNAPVRPPAAPIASAPSPTAAAPVAPATHPVEVPQESAPGPLRTRRSPTPDAADDDDLDDQPAPRLRPEDPSAWSAPADANEMTDAVTAAEPGAPGPIAAVPRSETPVESDAPLPPVTRVPPRADTPGREPWAPALSPTPDAEAFPETSGPVSAIAGAPDAGSPRSARTSVSALHTRPHVPEDEENLDETVVTRRKRTPWTLVPASGRSVPVTADVLIIGRRPVGDPAYPHAQLIAIDDDTRTVSKTHARLELRGDTWRIVDLDSTNGVLLTDAAGAEVEATAGVEADAGERFLLGDAEIRLERSEA